jgi:hypothetical protein
MIKFLLFLLISSFAAADGLADLKAAIERYSAKATIKGTLDAQIWSVQGKGKDATETRGQASAWVEYGPSGLRMQWGRNFLRQLDQESRERMKNVQAANQPSSALWAMELRRTYSFFDAPGELSRMIEIAKFSSETEEMHNGKPARALHFSVPLSGVPVRFRGWVKEFNSTATVLVDADGTPLRFKQSTQTKARAFLVVSFEQTQETDIAYSILEDHLICIRSEEKQTGGGGGEHSSSRTVRTFKPQ